MRTWGCLGNLFAFVSLDGQESAPEHKLVSPVIACRARGVGAWKRNGRYLVPGSGRRVYRLP